MQRLSPAAFRNIAFIMVALVVALVYFRAPHAPRLGDGLELTAVAAHLGVAHPSGYPLFTLIGNVALRTLPGEPYGIMLALCRVAAIGAAMFLMATTRRVMLMFHFSAPCAAIVACSATLMIAFSQTFRDAVVAVEVYGLNALFLTAITWLLLPVHEQSVVKGRLILAIALAFLAPANHLTSLCMMPLALLMGATFIRHSRRAAAPILAFVFFALIPVLLYASLALRAEQHHAILWGAPYSTGNLINHIRGGEYRHFQFLMLAPDRPFDMETYLAFATERVLHFAYNLGMIPFGAGRTTFLSSVLLFASFACGMVMALRDKVFRTAAAGLGLAIAAQVAFIMTYNIPDIADYFLGILVLAFPFMVGGACIALRAAFRRLLFPEEKTSNALALLAAVVGFLSLGKLVEWRGNGDENMVQTWLDRISAELPEGAAVITAGDHDLYPLWYLQFACGKRGDLFVYGGNFVRFPWFRASLPLNDPRRPKVGFRDAPPTTLQQYVRDLKDLAIDPILPYGPVYTTFSNPMERAQLSDYYRITAVAQLLPDKDLLIAQRQGLPTPPSTLYKIEPLK
ncbi:DUF2723 domain-containing protein [Candidatus Sumerlaeota bacterium]|nr:DUF2723 domain-containing protein [Candidatus Sumerlaeota bacterium]